MITIFDNSYVECDGISCRAWMDETDMCPACPFRFVIRNIRGDKL